MKRANRIRLNKLQSDGDLSVHHNDDKKRLLDLVLKLDLVNVKSAYEYFSGHRYMTKLYEEAGFKILGNDLKDTNIDSYLLFHKHIYDQIKYDLIDLDPYGLPFKFFPDIYLLMNDKCLLFVTSVKYHIPILNWRRVNMFLGYFSKPKPDHNDYIEFIVRNGLCHNYKVTYIDGVTMGKNTYRMAFYCEKIKSK